MFADAKAFIKNALNQGIFLRRAIGVMKPAHPHGHEKQLQTRPLAKQQR
jgi:hypothetical protein